ncbi:molybdate ABC transporter substrate-binding protein [Pedobacter sp. NJ-S-72]
MNYKTLAVISRNLFSFKPRYLFKKNVLLILAVLTVIPAIAQPVRVAVAANAQFVLRKLADDFKKKTGIEVEIISGSSGKLTAQIKKNGAPYDLFLSADMDFAQSVYADGFALSKPRVYALGSLIVCTTTGVDLENWKTLIRDQKTGKIAIANPSLAPYGKAAEQALNYYGFYNEISSRLVFGESISQVNTYVLKGVVNIGFTTESLVYDLSLSDQFKWKKIDNRAYTQIKQGAVLLKYSNNKNFTKNKRFYDYLFSAGAKAIFGQFGYRTL